VSQTFYFVTERRLTWFFRERLGCLAFGWWFSWFSWFSEHYVAQAALRPIDERKKEGRNVTRETFEDGSPLLTVPAGRRRRAARDENRALVRTVLRNATNAG